MKKKYRENIYLIFLFLFAFIFNFYVASKGVLPIDTFLHYDSASRILNGIIPVRDYWVVHGVTLDYFQALFFLIFGINWSSYILHSSIFNALISITTFIYFLKIGLKKEYSLLLSLSFSILAYPISGTPFIDQHAIFLSLFAFYFFYFGIKDNLKYLFFVPLLFGLAFFSKPVPTVYLMLLMALSFIFFLFTSKRFNIIKLPLLGSVFFLVALYLFILSQKIDLEMFLTQLIYYPISIGGGRFSSLNVNYDKIISNYKFILLPIIFSLFLLKNSFNKFTKDIRIFNFLIFTLFSFLCIYHQLLTKNQNFIFFLIPINLAFLILFLDEKLTDKSEVKYKSLIFGILIFCLFVTYKYHLRFNVDRKFHDLQNTNLENTVNAEKIHSSLSSLKWKTPNFEDPLNEITIINNVVREVEKSGKKIILMTNHNFISSISPKKIYTISRTYDSISFPSKNNVYFGKFKSFLDDQINLKNLQQIFIFIPDSDLQFSLERYVLEYFDPNCLQISKSDKYLAKIDLINCELK